MVIYKIKKYLMQKCKFYQKKINVFNNNYKDKDTDLIRN